MSSKKRVFEFLSNSDGHDVASVRDRKFKKKFVADTAYPTYSYGTLLNDYTFSHNETFMSRLGSTPPIETFSKQDGEFAFTASGLKSDSVRVNKQCVYKYGEKWVSKLEDAETMRAQDILRYDHCTDMLDFSDILPRGPVMWDCVNKLEDFISDIKSIRTHFNINREVKTITKPGWVDELNESHKEAKASRVALV